MPGITNLRSTLMTVCLAFCLGLASAVQAASLADVVEHTIKDQRTVKLQQVTNSYLKVLQHRQLSRLSEKNEKTYRSVLAQMERRVASGLATAEEIELITQRLADAQANHQADRERLRATQAQFEQLTGVAPQQLQAPRSAKQRMPGSLEQALQQAEQSADPVFARRMLNQLWSAHQARYAQQERLRNMRAHAQQKLEQQAQRFTKGKGSLLTLLEHEGDLFRANRAQTDMHYRVLMGEYNILLYTGQLFSFLDLDVPPRQQIQAQPVVEEPSANATPDQSAQRTQGPVQLAAGTLPKIDIIYEQPKVVAEGTHWLLQQDAGDYTLQLVGVSSLTNAKAFVKRHARLSDLHVVRSTRAGKRWYVVVFSRYGSARAARSAAAELPVELRQLKPWTRKFEDVQHSLVTR